MATSLPSPIAMPTSAAARAGASLTPSPTMATVRPGQPETLTLEARPGPLLAVSADGLRVEQLPREARLQHLWLETPRGSRLLRAHPRGAWLDVDPRDPAPRGRVAGSGRHPAPGPTPARPRA